MKRLVGAAALVLGHCTAVIAAPANAAPAINLCDTVGICGDLRNAGSKVIITTCDWSNKSQASRLVYQGQDSPCHDTDGYYLPAGWDSLTYNYCAPRSGCSGGWGYRDTATGWHEVPNSADWTMQLVNW